MQHPPSPACPELRVPRVPSQCQHLPGGLSAGTIPRRGRFEGEGCAGGELSCQRGESIPRLGLHPLAPSWNSGISPLPWGRKSQKMPRYSCARPSYLHAHLPAAFPLLLSLSDPLRAAAGIDGAARGLMELRGDSRGVEHREEVADVQQGPCLPPWQALSSLPGSPRGEEEGDARGVLKEMLRGYSRNAQGDAQEHPASQHPPLEHREHWPGDRWQPQVPRLSPQLRGGDGVAKRVPAPPGHTQSRGRGSALHCSSSSPALSRGGGTGDAHLHPAPAPGQRAG